MPRKAARQPSGNPPGQVNASHVPAASCPTSLIDPNMQALMKLYPRPTRTPTSPAASTTCNLKSSTRTTGSGSRACDLQHQRQYQDCSCVITCSAKCSSSRSGCGGARQIRFPYPTPVQGKNRSDSVTGSITHVFSPTMTNETVFAYTFVGFPNVFADPAKGRPHHRRLQLRRPVQERRRTDSFLWRKRRRGRSGTGIQSGRIRSRAAPPPACMPTSRCPAPATH